MVLYDAPIRYTHASISKLSARLASGVLHAPIFRRISLTGICFAANNELAEKVLITREEYFIHLVKLSSARLKLTAC